MQREEGGCENEDDQQALHGVSVSYWFDHPTSIINRTTSLSHDVGVRWVCGALRRMRVNTEHVTSLHCNTRTQGEVKTTITESMKA